MNSQGSRALSIEDQQPGAGRIVAFHLTRAERRVGVEEFSLGETASISGPTISGMKAAALPWSPPLVEGSAQGSMHIQYGRFDPNLRGTPVEDTINSSIQIRQNVQRSCRAGVHEAVGAGRGNRYTRRTEQCQSNRMIRHSHAQGRPSGRDNVWNPLRSPQNQGERPGPEVFHERTSKRWNRPCNVLKLLAGADMYDQWIAPGSLFGGKNPGYGFGIQGIGSQPINRFRRKSYEPSCPQYLAPPVVIAPGSPSGRDQEEQSSAQLSRSGIRHL